jgi:SET family sugar efflux transporter-like MFS transporter
VPAPRGAFALVVRAPFYRAAFVALFLSAVANSCATPLMTQFMRNLGASLPVAGLYFLTNLTAPVAGFLVGTLSDRQDDRLVLFRVCALTSALGWCLMAAATRVWMPFVIAALTLAVGGASMGQLFAAVRDELSRRPTGVDNRVVAAVRMAFTIGFVVGPVLGSWFGSAFGVRPLLLGAGICAGGQVLALGRRTVRRYRPAGPEDGGPEPVEVLRGRRRLAAMAPLLAFVAMAVLAACGDTVKFAYLPLYLANQLHVPGTVRGVVIAVQPLVEVALMPLVVRAADRRSPILILAVSVMFGVAANLALATTGHLWGMFLGQALSGVMWSSVAGLGVSIAQQLHPAEVATASGLFLSALTLSSAVGGGLGALGAATLGQPHLFLLPAATALVAAAGLLVIVAREGLRPVTVVPPSGEVLQQPI